MIDITLEDRQVRAALERLARRVADMTPVMQAIATELEARVEARFETATDPAGRPWAPLKASTMAAYLSRGKGNYKKDGSLTKKGAARLASRRPLYDTGDLLGSLTSSASRSQARVGFGQPYAAIHQFGGQAGRGKKVTIPARPFLPVTATGQWLGSDDRNAVLDILRSAIQTAADGG